MILERSKHSEACRHKQYLTQKDEKGQLVIPETMSVHVTKRQDKYEKSNVEQRIWLTRLTRKENQRRPAADI